MKTLLFLFLVAMARAAVVSVGQIGLNANLLVGSSPNYAVGVLVFGGTGTTAGDWSGKIILLDRGTNTFAEKAKAAQTAGAVGVIIADSGPSPAGGFAGQLLPAGTTSPLPVLLITQADGAALKAHAGERAAIGAAFAPPGLSPAAVVVLAQDSAGTVKAGASVLFAVISNGTAPLTFQWAKDGAAISGATSPTFSLAAAAAGDAGAYTCTSSNAAGSATSGPYALTVAP